MFLGRSAAGAIPVGTGSARSGCGSGAGPVVSGPSLILVRSWSNPGAHPGPSMPSSGPGPDGDIDRKGFSIRVPLKAQDVRSVIRVQTTERDYRSVSH